MSKSVELLRSALASHRCGWALGSFGAICEFVFDEDETLLVDEPFCKVTSRGGIRLDAPEKVVPFAYELPSGNEALWNSMMHLCVAEDDLLQDCATVLTEVGPDVDALREEDRSSILFDLGVNDGQVRFMIRTNDPDFIKLIRLNLGKPIFAQDNPVNWLSTRVHPHRVAITPIGRCEVYQKEGGPDTGNVSPTGPHTHLLETAIKTGLRHNANTPVPAGLVPVGSLSLPSPVFDQMGQPKAFDQQDFDNFQAVLAEFGAPQLWAFKQAALKSPETAHEIADDRPERAVLKVIKRQMAFL